MFSSSPNYTKLKTHLRLSINRLKLLEKKKTELAQKARKEIAEYIAAGKSERAKIRVEHIIREDYMVEAMEVVEMYCDLLLARFGLVTQMKELDEGLAEAISSLIWVAPRLQTDVQELKVVSEILSAKYGKVYADSCRNESTATISEKLKHKLSVQSPPKILVEKYLIEIAKNYNVVYEPDEEVLKGEQGKDSLLIDVDMNGPPQPPGFIGYPQPPMPAQPMKPFNYTPFQYPQTPSGGTAGGFVVPTQNVPNCSGATSNIPMTYNIPPGADSKDVNNSFLHEEMGKLPPAYDSLSPDDNLMNSNVPKPQPRSKFPENPAMYPNVHFPDLPDLPNVPSDNLVLPSVPNSKTSVNSPTAPDEIDFDDLNRRFEELKNKK